MPGDSVRVDGRTHIILYVTDQARSTAFYSEVLGEQPRLDVPGMTEFELPGGAVLGLMPFAGIRKLLGDALPEQRVGEIVPRAEVYLLVEQPETWHARAVATGGIELSAVILRDWGDVAGYVMDPDGHVLAFAAALPD